MSQDLWTHIDEYIEAHGVHTDDDLNAAIRSADAAGMPQISVAPNQGKLLHILARLQGARHILEIGTLAGYSTIWLARALVRQGRLISLEADPQHAAIARSNLARAGLSDVVDIREGDALDNLPKIAAHAPFDLVFIDADKPNIPSYFEWALRLTHPGSLIIVDNVVREGTVLESDSADPGVTGVRRFHEMLANETRVAATTIQTVGRKGHDGITIALVLGS